MKFLLQISLVVKYKERDVDTNFRINFEFNIDCMSLKLISFIWVKLVKQHLNYWDKANNLNYRTH